MELQKLQTFVRVVDAGSFNKAEELTYTSRQALKKQIDSLEEELDFKLLARSSKGITMTPAGKEFYSGVTKILTDTEELVERCRSIASNSYVIRIANPAHPRLIMEDVFMEFSRRYPDIKQEFLFMDKEELIDAVLNGSVDVAELVPPRKLDFDKIVYRKLTNMTYYCLLSPNHPLANEKELYVSDLSGQYVGLRGHSNLELIHLIREQCSDISLVETMGSDMYNMFKFCYNNGIYISRATFVTHMEPLVAIPLVTDLQAECGILYHSEHSPIVGQFLDVVWEFFPAGNEK